MAKPKPFDRFSARIKNLYVELNDYAYFHSPSEIGRLDRRFTGRTKVIERLKSLFTDYETPSGAYLVTGYRGAGKSSLVSRALAEVSAGTSAIWRESRLLRLIVPIVPLSILGGFFGSTRMLFTVALLSLLLLVYLLWTDPKFPDVLERSKHQEHYSRRLFEILGRYFHPQYPENMSGVDPRHCRHLARERWRSLLRCFFVGEETSPRARFRLMAQDLFVLTNLVLFSEIYLKLIEESSFRDRIATYLTLLAAYLGVNLVASVVLSDRDSEDKRLSQTIRVGFGEVYASLMYTLAFEVICRFFEIPWWPLRMVLYVAFVGSSAVGWLSTKDHFEGESQMRAVCRILTPRFLVFRHFWKRFKDYLRYSNRVVIKINLSQDDIKEIDILRLIAKNIYLKYREFNDSWRSDLHWKLVRVLMLVFFVGLIYNFQTVYSLNCALKHELHIACYFPSQGTFYLSEGAKAYPNALAELSEDGIDGTAIRRALSKKELSKEGERLVAKWTVREPRETNRSENEPTTNQAVETDRASEVSSRESRSTEEGGESKGKTIHIPHTRPFNHPFRNDGTGRLQRLGTEITSSVDLFIQDIYYRLYCTLPDALQNWKIYNHSEDLPQKESGWLTIERLETPIQPLPPTLDYLFVFYIVATWIALGFLFRWPTIGLVSHRLILKRLQDLNEMIESRVTRETGILPAPTGALFAINFGRRESRTSPNLTERDIEKYLLEILLLIDRIPRLTVRPEFIIIFDELDKIQHHENFTMAEKEVQQDGEFQGREFASVEAERERQHRILSLVSNLKHFLTTAPAKFIFIAGREMFDAALADISDRHFFMGSVFNEVLHVPSFHSDDSDGRLPDITSLTEQYLCRFLLPSSWWDKGLRLQVFGQYLKEVLWPDEERPENSSQLRDEGDGERCYSNTPPLAAREREKLLYELHNFITYLTYRSNGAPKKITRTIERFLVRFNDAEFDHPDSLCFGRSRRSLYLRFSYYDQYTFGLITYLGGPLIFSLNRAIKDYGDKILVSSSFLLDHVYKFHGEGFSWRNLELLPEIVDINRAPQLRELITNIMRFLAKSDISEIVSGLYDFKFTRRITEEISFLSKISEEESAAFNFTLDESLAIKRHFNRKLHKLLETYKDYPNAGEEKFVNSIAFVRMILGDLHFYDGELDSAIIEYMEAVQALRNLDIDNIRIDTLVLMVRNFLKLGLAFERKKSYESAFVTYGRISAMITQISERAPYPGSPLRIQTGGKKLHRAEEIFNQATFEGIRLIYQPMFARLQLIEKSTLGGITPRDIKNVILEFNRMLSPEQAEERFLIESEFKNKIADILYFKNGPMPKLSDDAYCSTESALCAENPHRTDLVFEERRRLPCTACTYYHQALNRLYKSYLGLDPSKTGRQPWTSILRSFEVGREMADRQNSLKELGITVSDIGNTFLSCSKDREIDSLYLIDLFSLLSEIGGKEAPPETKPSAPLSESLKNAIRHLNTRSPAGLNKLEEALTCYVTATLIFEWSGNSRTAARELSKILWVLREFVATGGHGILLEQFDEMTNLLVPAVLRHNYLSHEGTHRLEIEHLKEVLETQRERRPFVESVNLGRLAISASVIESLTVIDEIRLKLGPANLIALLDRRASPFAMFNSVFARIHTLRYRSKIHFRNLSALEVLNKDDNRRFSALPNIQEARQICQDELPIDQELENHEVLEFMITDSIYCCHEIIRFLAIYGTSYMASHSMKAAAHRNLSHWCDLYYNYLRDYETLANSNDRMPAVRRLEEQMRRMVGEADMVDLSPNYHAEMALRNFESAKQAHSEGKAYNALIDKMYYLTDDFADQLEHFCAALERFRINSGVIDKEIRKLKARLSKTAIYEADRYQDAGWAALQRPRIKHTSRAESEPIQDRAEDLASAPSTTRPGGP